MERRGEQLLAEIGDTAAASCPRLEKVTGIDICAMYPRDVIELRNLLPREHDGHLEKDWNSVCPGDNRFFDTFLRYLSWHRIGMEYSRLGMDKKPRIRSCNGRGVAPCHANLVIRAVAAACSALRVPGYREPEGRP
jgi:hypothetical protein